MSYIHIALKMLILSPQDREKQDTEAVKFHTFHKCFERAKLCVSIHRKMNIYE